MRNIVDALGPVVRVGLKLRLGAFLGGLVEVRAHVEVGKSRHHVRQHERVRLVGVQEVAALFGEIGLGSTFVDGVKKFFLEREEFVLAGVAMEGKLRLVERAAVDRGFEQAQQRFVARLAQLDLVERGAGLVVLAVVEQ